MTQGTHTKLYFGIYAGLLALTATTVAVAEIDLGPWNLLVALSIALVKASLVAWFFMHLRGSSGLVRVVAGAGVFWLAILFVLAYSDYATRHSMVPALPWPY